jgi:glycosyltransferase involved in cell wall biosynthesis
VLRQSYQNWELVVADNFSSDDVSGYVGSLSDTRIIYIRSDNFLSVTDNWNRALQVASGQYVIMLGDDDGLTPGYFERILYCMQMLGGGGGHAAVPPSPAMMRRRRQMLICLSRLRGKKIARPSL